MFTPTEPLNTPVLLIIFNRPETTKQVVDAIRKARPSRLYIAADGPRPGVEQDVTRCEEARRMATAVDWDCDVKTFFRDRNVNCGLGPSSAISWFFEHEDAGIILEDDCLPSQSFFWYCQELLVHYRNDTRVMHIGGNNFLKGWQRDSDYSYYFSQSGHIWGWATWKRAWEKFDFEIKNYPAARKKGFFDYFFLSRLEKFYRLRKFNQTVSAKGKADWWDYQWDFARYSQHGLAIVPNCNLVTNLGFGSEATHTRNSHSDSVNMKAMDIDLPLRHPPFMLQDVESDKRYFRSLKQDILKSKATSLLALTGLNNK